MAIVVGGQPWSPSPFRLTSVKRCRGVNLQETQLKAALETGSAENYEVIRQVPRDWKYLWKAGCTTTGWSLSRAEAIALNSRSS